MVKWTTIKTELLLQSEKSKIVEIVEEGERITEDNNNAKTFKKHFETCATKLSLNLPTGQDTASIMPLGPEWSFQLRWRL